jgi:Flp pilus assembly protein TadD
LAQSRVNTQGTGGIHTIQGRIYLPNGRSPEMPMTVKLQSSNFSTISVETDASGSFGFRFLAPGTYAVVVEAGENFEVAREYITIDPEVKIEGIPSMVVPKTFNVPVYLQLKRGLKAAAPEVVNARLAAVPKEALKHFEAGVKLAQSDKNEEAIQEYRQAIALYPSFNIALSYMGKAYLKLGRLEDAGNAFQEALKIDAKDFESKLGWGIVLLNNRSLEEAQKELLEAKELNSAAAAPRYYLGLLYLQIRKREEAKSELEQTEKLKNERDYPLTHYYLGGLYIAEKQYKLAVEELEKYLLLVPNAKDAERLRQTIADLRNKQN